MSSFNIAVVLASVLVLVLGLVSRRVEFWPISRPILAVLAGLAVGPAGAGWLMPGTWPESQTILREAARLALAVSVTGIALRTPRRDYRRLAGPVLILLTMGMALMWAISAGLAWATLGLSPLLAMALGGALAPTDPVVSSSIVTGTAAEGTLPDRLRSVLSLEAGANDGLGYLFVAIPVMLVVQADAGAASVLRDVVLRGVLLAIALGLLLGWLAGLALRVADSRGWVEDHSLLGMSVALSLLALSGAHLLGSDGILAAFAAGAAFAFTTDRTESYEDQNVQEAIAKLFTFPVFALFGAMLPLSAWGTQPGALLALAALVLALRRPVTILLLAPVLGAGLLRRDTLFLGWFGPIGVAAMYYALDIAHKTGDDGIWHAASLVIAASILVHGVTSGLGLALYRRAAARQG